MAAEDLSIDGVRVPRFLYGTAWKEDATQGLVEEAIAAGFRGVDTANQRKHYYEAGVGAAVAAAIESGLAARDELFLQTKFTFRPGQDQRLPYDANAPVADQVEQSFASSLEHLGTGLIDSYLLHGPTSRMGLTESDWQAWRAMEEIRASGRARLIGVSNFLLQQLQLLCDKARVRPQFVQNRCFARDGWDRGVRAFCAANGIVYQGFSLLTANREMLNHPELRSIAQRHGISVIQVVFRFAIDVGMIPLTGTTDAAHMRSDLEVFEFELEAAEVERIEAIAIR